MFCCGWCAWPTTVTPKRKSEKERESARARASDIAKESARPREGELCSICCTPASEEILPALYGGVLCERREGEKGSVGGVGERERERK